MINRRYLYQQIVHSPSQALVFVLCCLLTACSITAVLSLKDVTTQALQKDSQTLHGGDIIAHSHFPFSSDLKDELTRLAAKPDVDALRTWEFYSVVRAPQTDSSLLASLKIVEGNYPLYGELTIGSGKSFAQRLRPGSVVVDPAVLTRLNIKIGDSIKVGERLLMISDTVLFEPDRPSDLFSFGPRLFLNASDLQSLGLVDKNSRVTYKYLFRLPGNTDLKPYILPLEQAAIQGQEHIDTYRTAGSRIQRFLSNFLFFLNLCAVFILLLSGIGMYTSLSSFLGEQEKNIAIIKAIGATNIVIQTHYLVLVFILSLFGSCLGIAGGFGVTKLMLYFARDIIQTEGILHLSFAHLAAALSISCLSSLLFSSLPLLMLKYRRPAHVFQHLPASFKHKKLLIMYGAAITCFTGLLVFSQMQETRSSIHFLAGMAGLGLIAAALSAIFLRIMRRLNIPQLQMQIAMRGLFRLQGKSFAFLVTTSISLALIIFISLVERNLLRQYVDAYPEDTPNVFIVDIQKEQRRSVMEQLGAEASLYPVVRAKILKVNGVPVDRERELRRKSDNLARVFNLTYRLDLLHDEAMAVGEQMFTDELPEPQVSLLDTIAEIAGIKQGDTLTFDIQGVMLTATVSSIRTREKKSLNPFFYFVFKPETLAEAPTTFFSSVRLGKEKIAPLQNRLATAFPNISVIDMTQSIKVFAGIMQKMAHLIRTFMFLSVLAGIFILLSSIYATRQNRIEESVYFKICGATRRFITEVFTIEHVLLGLLSFAIAFVIAEIGTYFVCKNQLFIDFYPYLSLNGLILVLHVALVVLLSAIPLNAIIAKRPAEYLRETFDE